MDAKLVCQINRLKVFHVIKKIMTEENRCPTASEVAQTIKLSPSAVQHHFTALRGAEGLPLPVPRGVNRTAATTRGNPNTAMGAQFAHALRGDRDPDINLVPVDKLINANIYGTEQKPYTPQ